MPLPQGHQIDLELAPDGSTIYMLLTQGPAHPGSGEQRKTTTVALRAYASGDGGERARIDLGTLVDVPATTSGRGDAGRLSSRPLGNISISPGRISSGSLTRPAKGSSASSTCRHQTPGWS